jgi:hypothetical protein
LRSSVNNSLQTDAEAGMLVPEFGDGTRPKKSEAGTAK